MYSVKRDAKKHPRRINESDEVLQKRNMMHIGPYVLQRGGSPVRMGSPRAQTPATGVYGGSPQRPATAVVAGSGAKLPHLLRGQQQQQQVTPQREEQHGGTLSGTYPTAQRQQRQQQQRPQSFTRAQPDRPDRKDFIVSPGASPSKPPITYEVNDDDDEEELERRLLALEGKLDTAAKLTREAAESREGRIRFEKWRAEETRRVEEKRKTEKEREMQKVMRKQVENDVCSAVFNDDFWTKLFEEVDHRAHEKLVTEERAKGPSPEELAEQLLQQEAAIREQRRQEVLEEEHRRRSVNENEMMKSDDAKMMEMRFESKRRITEEDKRIAAEEEHEIEELERLLNEMMDPTAGGGPKERRRARRLAQQLKEKEEAEEGKKKHGDGGSAGGDSRDANVDADDGRESSVIVAGGKVELRSPSAIQCLFAEFEGLSSLFISTFEEQDEDWERDREIRHLALMDLIDASSEALYPDLMLLFDVQFGKDKVHWGELFVNGETIEN